MALGPIRLPLDRVILKLLYSQFSDALRAYFFGALWDSQNAEDCVQELFKRLAVRGELLELMDRAVAHTYLFKAAYNLAIEQNSALHKERSARESIHSPAVQDQLDRCMHAPSAESEMCERDYLIVLEEMRKKSSVRAQVLEFHRQGYRAAEIASRLSISEGSVEQHIWNARNFFEGRYPLSVTRKKK